MATFLLVRHALCDPVGHAIAGRAPDVHLNRAGVAQAEALASSLATLPLAAIYSSPLERALETAEPIGRRHGLRVETAPGFNEIDFGNWTGRTLVELQDMPGWREFNTARGSARIPGGETMTEVLARALDELERIRCTHAPGALVAVVSHGDVLRAVITHSVGISMDLMHRIEVSPASVSELREEMDGFRLPLLNWTVGSPAGCAVRGRVPQPDSADG